MYIPYSYGQAAQPDADFWETRMMILTFASKGYVVSAPDYAGYNVSKDLDHPQITRIISQVN